MYYRQIIAHNGIPFSVTLPVDTPARDEMTDEQFNRMMLIGYNWDVKSNRYNITSIECQNMQVSDVNDFTAVEVPKKARNELFNLPTAYKTNR